MLVEKTLSLQDEIPLPNPLTEPYWSENYCFFGQDPEAGTGIYLHFGRWAQDPTVWREQVYVFLPDGTSLLYRSLGRGDTSRGPGGALASMRCVDPGRHWNLQYAGPAIHATIEQLADAPLRERIWQHMDIDLAVTDAGPVLMYDIPDNSTIGRWHYEQEVELNGRIRFGGQEYSLHGNGWRDHTRGPRFLSHLRGHINISGKLPDRSFFSCFVLWEEHEGVERQVVSEGRMIRDGEFIAVKPIKFERFTHLSQYNDPIPLTLETGSSQIHLNGRPRNGIFISCNETFEFAYGAAPEIAPLVTLNQPTIFDIGDESGFGFSERSCWLPTRDNTTPNK